jgi:acyl phosphate:glycerol-3-phosphate acyltransferase
MLPAVALAIAYLSGSIPTAHIVGKLKGVDLRKHGSGNLGATNVVRVLGWKVGVMVFLVDLLKGFLPVALLPRYVDSGRSSQVLAIALGVAAILGHVRPAFLLWRRGGKGVATAAGVFLGLAWAPTLVVLVVWGVVFWATRYVSAASLASAALLPITLLVWFHDLRSPIFIAGVVIAAFVFWTHRANIVRLRRGEEHRFVRRGTSQNNPSK